MFQELIALMYGILCVHSSAMGKATLKNGSRNDFPKISTQLPLGTKILPTQLHFRRIILGDCLCLMCTNEKFYGN